MATLLKIRGLARGSAAGDAGVMRGRGLRVKSALGSQAQGGTAAKASRTPTAATITLTALYPGTYGNAIEVATDNTGGPSVTTAFKASTGAPQFTVHGPATATLAANQALVAAINADPTASQYVVASIAGAGTTALAVVALGAMTGGTDTGATLVPIYLRANQLFTVVVDVDDPSVAKVLRRSAGNYVSLGQP